MMFASRFRPLVLPFVLVDEVGTAKDLSRISGRAMPFCGGLARGRQADCYGHGKLGLRMAGLGAGLVVAIGVRGG